jgi:hypothetical protein
MSARETVTPNIANWVNVNTATGNALDVPVYFNYTFSAAPGAITAGVIAVTIEYVQKGQNGLSNPTQS